MRLKSISLLLIALFLVFWVVSSESDANNLLKWKASLRKQALLHPRLLLHTSTSSHVLLHKRLQKSNAIPGDDQIPEVMGLDRATINGPQGNSSWLWSLLSWVGIDVCEWAFDWLPLMDLSKWGPCRVGYYLRVVFGFVASWAPRPSQFSICCCLSKPSICRGEEDWMVMILGSWRFLGDGLFTVGPSRSIMHRGCIRTQRLNKYKGPLFPFLFYNLSRLDPVKGPFCKAFNSIRVQSGPQVAHSVYRLRPCLLLIYLDSNNVDAGLLVMMFLNYSTCYSLPLNFNVKVSMVDIKSVLDWNLISSLYTGFSTHPTLPLSCRTSKGMFV